VIILDLLLVIKRPFLNKGPIGRVVCLFLFMLLLFLLEKETEKLT